MTGLRFRVPRTTVMGGTDSGYVHPDQPLGYSLEQAVLDLLGTDVEVEIGGVRMILAAWRDPAHWSTDWAEALGIDYDDVDGAVAALLAGAVEA